MKGVVALAGAVALSALPFSGALAQQTQPGTQPQTEQTQPQQSPAGTSSQAGGAQVGIMIASDSLLGTTVRDSQGKDVGEVSKLMIDANGGKVTSVIIRQGGTLGVGGKEVSVPWDALKLQRGRDQELVVTMQQEMLQPTPQAQQEEQRRQQQESQPPAASPPTSGQEQQPQQPQQPRQRQ